MATTDNEKYKNVKKINKSIPETGSKQSTKSGGSSMMSFTQNGVEALFGGKIDEFLMENAQHLVRKYSSDLPSMKAAARRYVRDFPVLTVVGATAVGLVAGLLAVNAWTDSSRQR